VRRRSQPNPNHWRFLDDSRPKGAGGGAEGAATLKISLIYIAAVVHQHWVLITIVTISALMAGMLGAYLTAPIEPTVPQRLRKKKGHIALRILCLKAHVGPTLAYRNGLDMYLTYCQDHGYFLDHPHGYRQIVRCPKCMEKKRPSRATRVI
jgi:hypothetical protein